MQLSNITFAIRREYIIAMGGDLHAALILSQLLYYQERFTTRDNPEGWFYITIPQMASLFLMSERTIKSKIKQFRELGLIQVRRKKAENLGKVVNWYKVDIARLNEMIGAPDLVVAAPDQGAKIARRSGTKGQKLPDGRAPRGKNCPTVGSESPAAQSRGGSPKDIDINKENIYPILVEIYWEMFKKKYGEPPIQFKKQWGVSLKTLISKLRRQGMGYKEIAIEFRRRLERFFADEWYRKTAHDLTTFVGRWSAYRPRDDVRYNEDFVGDMLDKALEGEPLERFLKKPGGGHAKDWGKR